MTSLHVIRQCYTAMASVHRIPGKPNWICFYTDRKGARRCKSSLTKNKREAERVCAKIQGIEDQARTGNLTEEKARRVIESVVGEIMAESGAPIERATVREHFTNWLREAEQSESTQVRYEGIVTAFLEFLGSKASGNLAALQVEDVRRYKTSLRDRVSPSTVNTHLKVIRVALENAVEHGVFNRNPARLVKNMGTQDDRHERRAFTLPELKKLLAVCGTDWKTAILFSLYGGGLRLGDIQALTWANLDLSQNELTLRTRKTDRVQILPLVKPLRQYVDTLPAGDEPNAPLCPSFQGKAVNWLSNQFYEVMASAGLVTSRGNHQKKEDKKGRGARRQLSPISFHALRHTATSLLKNAGVSDVVARDIIGHESTAISRNYTHIESDTKRAALEKIPDITRA